MRRSIATLVLILLLVLVIVAASIFILRGTPDAKDAPAEKPTVTVAPPRETEQPLPSDGPSAAPDGTPAPSAPTAVPTAEPTPEPTSEPTPTPTPTPTPAPVADGEGSFRSDSGTGLNIRVDWKTFRGADGKRRLTCDVSVVSYSISATAQYKSITMRIGEKSWSADFAGVQYDGDAQIVTPAASFTVDAPAAGTPVTVEWAYGGTYSGKELNVITAKGAVQ